MKVAMIGTRGIPARYGGFETAVEQISTRLVQRGHEVVVYNRSGVNTYEASSYEGVRLVRLPTYNSKHLATIVHSALSTLHATLRSDVEVVHYFTAGAGALSFLPRLFGKRTVCSVDGLDWSRRKWGRFARAYLKLSEQVVSRVTDAIVTDSPPMASYYLDEYGRDTSMIAYGSNPVQRGGASEWLGKFGLEPERYLLFVGRLVPEKNAHVLIDAFEKLDTDMKLVIVGDDPWGKDYIDSLKQRAGTRVVFTGYLYGEGCQALQANAYAFVLPGEVGGTPPVLLEAMGSGNCVLVSDTPSHRQTVGEAGLIYDLTRAEAELPQALENLITQPELVAEYRNRAAERAAEQYRWDEVVRQHEELYARLLDGKAVEKVAVTEGTGAGKEAVVPERPRVASRSH